MSSRKRCRFLPSAVLLAGIALWATSARADLFLLETGGRVEGEWLNRDEQPLRQYLVRTEGGLVISLAPEKVRETVRESPALAEYRRRAPLAANSIEAQWSLAQWCAQSGLTEQRRSHLQRIVELDPNHEYARRALGYQFLHGEWKTRDQMRRQEGYEFYDGRWRTPQEIEILEARARTELAQKDWLLKLRRWRRDLAAVDKAKVAWGQIAAVKDPVATLPLRTAFSGERDRRVKLLYADVLANINTAEAVGVLTDRALNDPDEEVYYYCLDKLAQLDPPHVSDPFITALGDASNFRVNRAATALARLKDRSAISPLIDALITTHTQVLPGRPGTGPDSTTTTFGSGGTVMKQNEGPKVLIRRIQNQQVLDALAKMTGQNFDYDQQAWRFWHAQEKISAEAKQPLIDARRQ